MTLRAGDYLGLYEILGPIGGQAHAVEDLSMVSTNRLQKFLVAFELGVLGRAHLLEHQRAASLDR